MKNIFILKKKDIKIILINNLYKDISNSLQSFSYLLIFIYHLIKLNTI